ncbi:MULTISPECIES: viroplasmin family protein [unclassified Gemella]|uniref:ribonuclease H1 domain-containing protein n=1 Tax=unclassified Gemella TaxID=2624949 RepID=UPI0015CF83AB|nr:MULTISPECIES: ribonuclease H family protein [unclassified Gemella]MBF0710362.1 ribonuclease H family protein [Gemella sp. GL1.1]NYS27706.1 viroplasmin family protein [Gemella sp. GL1]
MANKFYAVRVGRQPGIYGTWSECEAQVKAFKGAVYKSFKTQVEALNFLAGQDNPGSSTRNQSTEKKSTTFNPSNPHEELDGKVFAYVDGSFDANSFVFGSGLVIVNGNEIIKHKFASANPELSNFRNVAGELEATKFVITYAINQGLEDIYIYHDYEGISAWPLGRWQAKLDYTKEYARLVNLAAQKVRIHFMKVAAHSGIELNEEADKLAKEAIIDFKNKR